MKRVLLIQPAPYRNDGSVIKQEKLWIPGLTLPLLSALTPGFIDLDTVYETVDEVPYEKDYDLVAISAMGIGIVRGIHIAEKFRKKGVPTMVGGIMASLARKEAEEHFDIIASGEGEIIWRQIMEDLKNNDLKKSYDADGLCDLNSLPVPDYKLITGSKFGTFAPVQGGRGCIHACEFCSIHKFNRGTYRPREVSQVLRDVDAAVKAGKKMFLIIDDNIAAEPEFAKELFTALMSRDIRWMGQCNLADLGENTHLINLAVKSGCRVLNFGLETISQENLDIVNKGFQKVGEYGDLLGRINDAGIFISSEMILGMDYDDPSVFDRIVDFIEENRIASPKFYILTPIPGTDWFDRVKKEGRLLTENWMEYTSSKAVFKPGKMSARELEEGYWKLYRRLYSVSSIMKRMFMRKPNFDLFFNTFLFLGNLHYRSLIDKGICPGVV